eukprot:gnl/TRDRNA2_/TRDRNA2_192578_c0_seq1.p1 gnl/TRDRNA2_/TRDRNA2_192578_c0~~gnl/TRDRNA2_/TRDRNA2_192578_c0_seq1.p1  ORF type:complete len:386 (+),score=77.56 gnl/TRDRNA2_/TRDRNA2_192578_c0_seq1:70-1227(+)
MDLEAAVDGIACAGLPMEQQREGLQTVHKLLSNIVNSPAEEKFRRVKMSNPAIQKRLFPQCFDLLRVAGFKEESPDQLVYRGDPSPDFHEVVVVCESLLLSFGGEATRSSGSSAASSASTGGYRCAPQPTAKASNPAQSKRAIAEQKEKKAKEEQARSQASAQDQLAELRKGRANRYQNEQDAALARHLSGRDADSPYDAIAALNANRGAVHSFVSCTRCGVLLRYNASTRAQAVLCVCGKLLQPLHMQDQAFVPRSPSDLPVEPGEPVEQEDRPRRPQGPFITVRGQNGETSRLPLHSVLQMVRQHEARQAVVADSDTIEALPTRAYDGDASKVADTNCQICMEDFKEGDELKTLPCFHIFHAACIDQWLKVNSICPTCRHKVG